MDESEFQARVTFLTDIPFREDFETALYELYREATSVHRATIREMEKTGKWNPPKPWENPTDYGRSDLPRERRMRQELIAMSIRDGGKDFRDDLMTIAYCYHNLAALGIDADAALNEVAEISAPSFAATVRNFTNRSPDEKSLQTWMLKIVQNSDGPAAEFVP